MHKFLYFPYFINHNYVLTIKWNWLFTKDRSGVWVVCIHTVYLIMRSYNVRHCLLSGMFSVRLQTESHFCLLLSLGHWAQYRASLSPFPHLGLMILTPQDCCRIQLTSCLAWRKCSVNQIGSFMWHWASFWWPCLFPAMSPTGLVSWRTLLL